MMNNDATMKEKADVLRNDQRVREQGSTYLAHTHSDVGGRFAAISSPVVVGSEAVPNYPAAFLNHDPVPDEPALGVNINEMPTCGEPHELKASLAELSALEPSPLSPAQATPSPSSQALPPLADEGLGLSSRTYRRF